MPKRNRNSIYYTWAALAAVLLSVAVMIAWDWSSDLTEQIIRDEQGTQQHIEYAEDRIDEKCLSLKPVALRDCIHQEIESARDHDRANQDLNAQQQMALFTKIMGYTAIAGLVLGAGSIALIFATLREMGNTNRIMREEQRPWLVIDTNRRAMNAMRRMFRSDPQEGFFVAVTNKGKLPADDAFATFVTFSYDTLTADKVADMVESALPNLVGYKSINVGTVYQGEKVNLPVIPMKRGYRTMGSGDKWALMTICVYYWEEEVKLVWNFCDVERPPENVLKRQKT